MLKVVINYPSEMNFFTVGQLLKSLLLLFAISGGLSHLVLLLGSTTRPDYVLSFQTTLPSRWDSTSTVISLCPEMMCPWLKIDHLTELLKELGSLSLNI